jgi:hypothetical protein
MESHEKAKGQEYGWIEYKRDGSIERYKARLVEKGFTQEYELNFK